ncbi:MULTISPECIES: LysR family transcriptional regulator [Agrobacterium]|uniref:HTH-type transcriptional regulator TtuA n=1 Tax=Agrobacterium rubi TaxID=28099 RepID=A0AAE7RAB5_9HYPH|nr:MULTISPECIES: LysR family transcriptional regulator [Agrobacterium]MBN7807848.1 LysR family transcriptional regulator [Agrobacterium rosae]NTE89808.1 LysR family transcriptional regulator [Agrobacterium rubi]NTF05342.1 LysR family transcriptional regulator [Agrobacterium rubi]NTF10503.1 LysR family transcriptional regulator [Agrobacterium rubi]NTF22897.1 LysR family transcriptional regulator [Agrobacterium rubi]
MDLQDVAIFVEIASGESLSSAARRLGTTPMTASRRLANLEAEVGVRLVHRTTRSVALTVEGEDFLPLARMMLEAELSSRAIFETGRTSIAGTLRLTSPAVFGQNVVIPLVRKLRHSYPSLRVDLTLSDNVLDIVALGLDLALRLAPMRDSGLVARQLAANPRVLLASPDYLASAGTPTTIADLEKHECLALHAMPHWPFDIAGKVELVKVSGGVSSNSVAAVREAAIQGMGLAMLTYWDVKDELQQGRLVEVGLKDGSAEDLAIWAVFPTRQHVPARVRAFIKLLEEALNK